MQGCGVALQHWWLILKLSCLCVIGSPLILLTVILWDAVVWFHYMLPVAVRVYKLEDQALLWAAYRPLVEVLFESVPQVCFEVTCTVPLSRQRLP